MQWQFRKALESFESYKRITSFKNEIENGDENTLDTVLREVDLILSEKNEKIITKVLALRFVRDIMVLGQEDVVKRVEKLIPQLTKICSYELNSSDPDRGQSFFHDHPTYLKQTDEDEKRQIDTLGSTFLILSLQSIFHWAKWIPLDSSGQQSIYSKAYESLVQRGVKFPASFHYYKQSDTDKFKNMYKMEFFTDSYDSVYSQQQSEQSQSQLSLGNGNIHISRGKQEIVRSKVRQQAKGDGYTGEAHLFKTIPDFMAYLNNLKKTNKSRKMGDLLQIHRKVQQMYQIKAKMSKEEKKWSESYLINFSMLNSNLISYEQFLQRSISEEIQLEVIQQQEISIVQKDKDNRLRSPNKPTEFSKIKEPKQDRPDDLLKQQQMQFKTKINSLLLQLQQKGNQLAVIKSNAQKERLRLVDDYQSRITLIKSEVRRGQQDRGALEKQLEKDNERLRGKVAALQEQLGSLNYSTARERELQTERNQLLTKVKRLELENQKLNQGRSNKNNYQKQLASLQNNLKEKQGALDRARAQTKKIEKQIQNYMDEAGLYKSELINQRNKHEQKLQSITKTNEALQLENKSLKQKNLELLKSHDVKELEKLNMREELKRYQGKLRDATDKKEEYSNNRSEQYIKSKTNQFQSPNKLQSPNIDTTAAQVYSNDKRLKYSNYEDLYNQLRPNNKELFVRLCRCGLKKKDILMKENELQVGIISDVISQHKLKFVLHFTNTSEKQIQNLKLEYILPQSYLSTLDYQIDNKYVFCIQPQQQQKITVIIANKQPPFLKERAILQLSYDKNGVNYSTNLFLPFVVTKFFDFYKIKPFKLPERAKNLKEAILLKYNKKILPKPISLKGYFEQAEETSPNKFQFEAYHRETDLSARVLIQVMAQTETMLLQILSLKQKLNDKQRYIFQELISFLQVAFKK